MAERSGAALISTVEARLCLPWLAVTAVPSAAGQFIHMTLSDQSATALYVGLDVGGTKLLIVSADGRCRIIDRVQEAMGLRPSPRPADSIRRPVPCKAG